MKNRLLPHWRGIYRFLRDEKADWKPKVFVVFAVLYLLFPFDFVPDFIPFAGWLDDIGIAALASWYLARAAEKYDETIEK